MLRASDCKMWAEIANSNNGDLKDKAIVVNDIVGDIEDEIEKRANQGHRTYVYEHGLHNEIATSVRVRLEEEGFDVVQRQGYLSIEW